MSIKVMSAVWDLDIPGSEKFVLLALADNANDSGVCWPSAETIARKCSRSVRAVRYSLKSLENDGWIEREERSGTSSYFHLDLCKICTPAIFAPLQKQARPLQLSSFTPAESAPKPIRTIKNHQLSVDQFSESWNEMAERARLSKVQAITKPRREAFRLRLAEHGHEAFGRVLAAVKQSKFHCGDNDRGWKADFDWILTSRNFVRLLESQDSALELAPPMPDDLVKRWIEISGQLTAGEIDRKQYDELVGPVHAEAAERRGDDQAEATEHNTAIAGMIHSAVSRA